MIYAPALRRAKPVQNISNVSPNAIGGNHPIVHMANIPNIPVSLSTEVPMISTEMSNETQQIIDNRKNTDYEHVITRISNLVDNVRKETEDGSKEEDAGAKVSSPMVMPRQNRLNLEDREVAQRRTEQAILEAEKFKALVADPPGESSLFPIQQGKFNNMTRVTQSGLSDDDFFHLTCHVDAAILTKIEKGDFVDLEKLVPKDRKRKSDENHLEWIQTEGNTFLAPVNDRLNKITSYRKWEQAFRVYATIYCGANPDRSMEIRQYVSIINTAASSFIWENVYEYDVTFRHLMAFNLSRSWAVTYNQMWNICMRDPIPNKSTFQFRNGNNSGGGSGGSSTSRNHSNRKKKPSYCWNFNKGIQCKYGKKCRFIERCSYCDAGSHGVVQCPKLTKNMGNNLPSPGVKKD